MTAKSTAGRQIPIALQRNLLSFGRIVRRLKILEVSLAAVCGLLLSYLAVFALDRLVDTPAWVRAFLLVAGAVGVVLVLPSQIFRWVWRTRSLEQVARVVARKDANAGDRLLGVIELTGNDAEFERSPVLCDAAIRQVDEEFHDHAHQGALPDSRHRTWAKAIVGPIAACGVLFALVPDAAVNAAQRWFAPFGDTARYTFARVESLPDALVVAKGEASELLVELTEDSDWRPARATADGAGHELVADLSGRSYQFHVPPLNNPETVRIGVGDFRHAIGVRPVDRPGIATLDASIHLPDYLGIAEPRPMDGRAGILGVVEGSRVKLTATTTRDLRAVHANGAPLPVAGRGFEVPELLAERSQDVVLDWTDVHGLDGREPMTVALRSRADQAPTVSCEGLRNETVLLESDTLVFQVHAGDDFGVRRMGLCWEGIPDAFANGEPVKGEKVLLTAADGEQETVTAEAAFCAELLGISAQPLLLSAWVEDASPGRERVTSTPLTLFVMTPEQHMIWLTKQLTAWDDEAREVHERELALYDENLALRALSPEELGRPASLRRLESQSRAERANAHRLGSLIGAGQSLLAQAARNPEFNSSTLDRWAEMMRALQDISSSRMPSVASLLASAARSRSAPSAGVNRLGPSPGTSPQVENVNKLPGNPSVVDNESTMLTSEGGAAAGGKGGKVNRAPAPLRLATTTLQGKGGGGGAAPDGPQPDATDETTPEELAKAIEEQRLLLEEFARLQGDFGKVLAALTGSTFVKRFKAESREQGSISGVLHGDLQSDFGRSEPPAPTAGDDALGSPVADGVVAGVVAGVVGRENRASTQVSLIQDDLVAFVDRLEGQEDQRKFKTVLEEMRDTSPSVEIADLGEDVVANLEGDALVGTEFWADKLDYWAELLVGPG
jgi:hypothetical protein